MWCITIKIRAISKFWIFRELEWKCSKLAYTRNIQNFDMALVFIVMHHMSSYVSINSRNTLDSGRMRSFLPGFLHFNYFFRSFQGVFYNFEKKSKKSKLKKSPWKLRKKSQKWEKTGRKYLILQLSNVLREFIDT